MMNRMTGLTTTVNVHDDVQKPALSPPGIVIDKVSVCYDGKAVIRNATLTVPAGELMALVGPSGCGKTSLLHSVNRMTDSIPGCAVSGSVWLDGENILGVGVPALQVRRRIGLVFQQPNPFPLSIAENIRFPLREHGLRNKARLNEQMEQVLQAVGLWEEVCDRLHKPALSLSGGQQQRLCMARALALEPEVLLLDEPCSALDPIATEVIEDMIVNLKGRYTLLMVTHNLAQARRIADHVTVCWVDDQCGCVVESGSRESIFVNSSHPVTRAYCCGDKG